MALNKTIKSRVNGVRFSFELLPMAVQQGAELAHRNCAEAMQEFTLRFATISLIEKPHMAIEHAGSASGTGVVSALGRWRERGIIVTLRSAVAHNLGTTRFMADQIAVMYLGKLVEIGPTDAMFDAPRHPYTQALLSAALPLRLDRDHQPAVLRGEVPSPINPPSGCAFHPRCQSYLGDLCKQEAPRAADVGSNHVVSCHLHDIPEQV